MSNKPLRLEQYETVLYNSNFNPMGIPEAVTKALAANIDSVGRYPQDYYSALRESIADYTGCSTENIVLGNGSSDLLRLFVALLAPKKALIPVPSPTEYETVLSTFGCETVFHELKGAEDFKLDVAALCGTLDSSYDMIILGNPNNPTSQLITREDIEVLAEACHQLDIFLLIDEMYIEFTEQYSELTAVPLVDEYDNIAVLRSISKFFAVPGLRLAYAIMDNPDNMAVINMTATPNSISTLTAIAATEMFKDKRYISESRSQIFTERNLIYSAMSTCRDLRLYKPYANFMLVRLLRADLSAATVAANCNMKGLVLRNCSDFRGLSDKYLRFCFMKPNQNDLLVNTILEQI
jgi:threonine-phosphate decarboxylase